MPGRTDVKFPHHYNVTFLPGCIRCREDNRGETIKLKAGRGVRSFEVPACSSCRFKMRLQRACDFLLKAIIAVLVWHFVWPLIEGFVPTPLHRFGRIGLAFAAIFPLLFWGVIFPPTVDVSADSDSVTYEFQDHEYAKEFHLLNEDGELHEI